MKKLLIAAAVLSILPALAFAQGGVAGKVDGRTAGPRRHSRSNPHRRGSNARACQLLKHQRQDFVEILLPDRIDVGAAGYPVDVLDLVFR